MFNRQAVAGNVTVTVPTVSGVMSLTSAVETLSNKRIQPRIDVGSSGTSSVSKNHDNHDMFIIDGLGVNIAINNPVGTPTNGQKYIYRLRDNGSSRTITWGSAFAPVGVTLPTSTTASKTLYVGMMYNSSLTRWDVIAVASDCLLYTSPSPRD